MHSARPSLIARALLAVLLTIGFYGLALLIAGLLLLAVYAEIRYGRYLDVRFVLICLVSAMAVLWAILPRRDRFVPPGPRLDPETHPRLFGEVKEIAHEAGQEMPAEIYLVPDANAFVTERGGVMGVGGRRVMGVGLPLLQTLTVSQFRAVVAHEFGHFYGGDTRLGPWVYKTGSAIGRTIQGLGGRSPLQLPFHWYGLLFLRITNAVSRHQEFLADQLAARVAGARPLIEGLRAIYGVAFAFQAFWRNEVVPVLGAGYRPPLTEGFGLFLRAPFMAEAMQQAVEQELENAEADPYDTHPSLQERIAALQALPPGPEVEEDTPALDLLGEVPALEQELLGKVFGQERVAGLSVVAWQDVGSRVWLPFWEKTAGSYTTSMRGVTPARLPEFLRAPGTLSVQLQQAAGRPLAVEEIGAGAASIAAMALTVRLARLGWQLDAAPGARVSLRRSDNEIQPFVLLSDLASGELAPEAWRQICAQAGIAGLELGDAL